MLRITLLVVLLFTLVFCCSAGGVCHALENGANQDNHDEGLGKAVSLNRDFTIVSYVNLSEQDITSISTFWLVGLAENKGKTPDTLALRWVNEGMNWFPIWHLQLASNLDILPREYVVKKSIPYIELGTLSPLAGHEYRVDMSYTANNHVLSVRLTDLTDGKILYAANCNIGAHDGVLYPSSGWTRSKQATATLTEESIISAENVTVTASSAIYGLPIAMIRDCVFRLLQTPGGINERYGIQSGAEFWSNESIGFGIKWPAQKNTGEIKISYLNNEVSVELATTRWTSDESFVWIHPDTLPLGMLELIWSYDEGYGSIEMYRRKVTILGGDSLFPFSINPWRENPDNITNISDWLEKPAGKFGFASVNGENFLDGAGRPIYFFGVSIAWEGCFPSHDEAGKLARQLAGFGINLVRFHGMDMYNAPKGLWNPLVSISNQRTFDDGQLDRLDYFVAQLKENGIYCNFNLHVERTMLPEEGFPEPEKRPKYDKGLDIYYPEIIIAQKDYARNLLTHMNPYTGNRYTDEPALVMVEITNEDGLIQKWGANEIDSMPDMYKRPLYEHWQEWLKVHYCTTEALRSTWGGLNKPTQSCDQCLGLPEGESLESGVSLPLKIIFGLRTEKVQSDYISFLWDIENRYFIDMYNYIKIELGTHALVAGSQVGLSPQSIQDKLDYVDAHRYWQHPVYPDGNTRDWYVVNTSMVSSPDGGTITRLAEMRVVGKPYMVSEYNHPAINTYGSEAYLLIGAYGAFQNFGGIIAFDWTSSRNYWPKHLSSIFEINANPAKLVTLPAVAAMFLRGDVTKGSNQVLVSLGEETQRYILRKTGNPYSIQAGAVGIPNIMALQQKMGLDTEAEALDVNSNKSLWQYPKDAQTSIIGSTVTTDTGELHWDLTETGRGVITVNTERSKALIGYCGGRTVNLSGVVISPGDTRQDGWAAITLTMIEGRNFDQSGRILLTATGYFENKGMASVDLGASKVTVEQWGQGPPMVEGISAIVELPVASERVVAYALDEAGNRRGALPVAADISSMSSQNTYDGTARHAVVKIGPEYRTLWYEIEILPE